MVIDKLLKVELVNAFSGVATATLKEHSDLLATLRVAGASFGAVVEFTHRAHQQKEPVWAGTAAFSLDKHASIVKPAKDFALRADLDSSFHLGFTKPYHTLGSLVAK